MAKTIIFSSTETTSFKEQLQQFAKDTSPVKNLKIPFELSETELAELASFLERYKNINKLSLQISHHNLQNPHFLACINQLNAGSFPTLELTFPPKELEDSAEQINSKLMEHIAPLASFPIRISNSGALKLDEFQRVIIKAIQKKYKEGFSVGDPSHTELDELTPGLLHKKIKLKSLINRARSSEKMSDAAKEHIQIEVQHVETVEHEIALEEVVEVQAEVQLQEIQPYFGQLIDYSGFAVPTYKAMTEEATANPMLTEALYSQIQDELFAKFTHAIQYLSPAAAEYLALNLPSLVTINKDNLPSGFLLKQTADGALVLDYDPFLEREHANPFTPLVPGYQSSEPIYDIELKEEDIRRWMGTDLPYSDVQPNQLVNLWIKYGDEGVSDFFKKLKDSTSSMPELAPFIMQHYLAHLPQWDHLYTNQPFFDALNRISHYDAEKFRCLQRFLIHTGSSRHDLKYTINAFEVFWSELTLLCTEQKIDIAKINLSDWSTSKGGTPVVFMERMLCILKNARTLEEQFSELKEITLDNYGAYYASRYEEFKMVSKVMELTYKASDSEGFAFDKNCPLYRCNMLELMWDYNHYCSEDFYVSAFRFTGLQTTGITVSSLRDQFFAWADYQFGRREYHSTELLAALFFISHERFTGQKLKDLFMNLYFTKTHDVLNNALPILYQLYKLDIKLNEVEGLIVCLSIGGMNSAEFERLKLNKADILKKLFNALKDNKLAVLKLFEMRAMKETCKWPFLYALDTAELLAEDRTVADTYPNDLLLFAGLINSAPDEVYHHGRPEKKEQVEKVRAYLSQAATLAKPNNLQYAIQVMLHSKNYFSYAKFFSLCDEIKDWPTFDNKKVDEALLKHDFRINAEIPTLFTGDSADLKARMIHFIMELEATHPDSSDSEEKAPTEEELAAREQQRQELEKCTISQLQEHIQKAWNAKGILFSIIRPLLLSNTLNDLRQFFLKQIFNAPFTPRLLNALGEQLNSVPDLHSAKDFEQLNLINNQLKNLAALVMKMTENTFVGENEEEFIALFKTMNFARTNYEIVYSLFSLLAAMPNRNYKVLLKEVSTYQLTAKPEQVLQLINYLNILNINNLPTEYIETLCQLITHNPDAKDMQGAISQIGDLYSKDNKDPLLAMLMTHPDLSFKHLQQILYLSKENYIAHDKLSALLVHLLKTNTLTPFLKQLIPTSVDISEKIPEKTQKIVAIMSKSHALVRSKQEVDYTGLAKKLGLLSEEHLDALHHFYETTPVSSAALLSALPNDGKVTHFANFLLNFEKAPFGDRDLTKQFSCSEVERVINQSRDLLNDSSYTYQYRKQLMEAFLFVNEAGEHLPVYYNKPAKELTNAEIKAFFNELKQGTYADYPPFHKRLLALGLMREAMYRSTGEFPYSTQIISLIDGIMHHGDFISNIDTGQGKSLIDCMKATLLWVDSERVDLTTSSLVDARRDIANYSPFLKLLGIPFSARPIDSLSSAADFQSKGINFSTFAQLSLFFAKMKITDKDIDTTERVSLVTNESDYAILDDRIIYRFATADGSGISHGQEWIYYGINEFVSRPEYIANEKSTAAEDIQALKEYLKTKARSLKKSPRILNKFSEEDYLSWIESALTVHYVLKENVDYVIPEALEKKVINGTELHSKVVKILMKDGKVSPDSTFGNGMHQLLYAHLNQKYGTTDFVIEPQNRTILSSNSKNFIDYYRRKKGFIWGSSGTVGSQAEMAEQYSKFGFEFGKAEPHQKNQVQFYPPAFLADEAAQFAELIRQLTTDKSDAPSLVFCKDIETAQRLSKAVESHLKANPSSLQMQLYTGLGREEDYIQNASKPGMITITTSALGRNTDIAYDKVKGLKVWHTYVDAIRGTGQKSGRTGRQGSKGEVHFILNQQELGDKKVAELREEIDQFGAIERSINEELYDVLDYLLAQVNTWPHTHFPKGKATFLREKWSQFSTEVESQFREIRHNATYDRIAFLTSTVAAFNDLVHSHLAPDVPEVSVKEVQAHSERTYSKKTKYHPMQKEVRIKDCIPPIDIAYHLLHKELTVDAKPDTNAIKEHLKKLFARLTKGNFAAENNTYLHFLVATPATQKDVVMAHKEFLTEYLTKARQKSTLERWFGYASKLNNIASNQAYLLMFHAFSSIPNPTETSTTIVDLEVIKASVNSLLDDYLETSWFINKERKQWAKALKSQISEATSIDELISYLTTSQIETAKRDIATNRHAFKPLHFFGHSRYQHVISKALNLSTALAGKTNVDGLTEQLTPLLVETTDNTPITDTTEDELKHRASSSKKRDRANASVLSGSLHTALAIKGRGAPKGMSERKGEDVEPDLSKITPHK